MIPNTTHPMFEQAPQKFCEIVLEFLAGWRHEMNLPTTTPMQTLRVNGYDMAYLEVGNGPPLVCVHGTLGDFRTWSAVIGPLSKKYRVISVSLRHFFPEHWDGVGDDYLMAQHVADVIGFIEQLDAEAGGSDGAFARRAHLVPRRAAAARAVAQAGAGRAGRRARCHARSGGCAAGPSQR